MAVVTLPGELSTLSCRHYPSRSLSSHSKSIDTDARDVSFYIERIHSGDRYTLRCEVIRVHMFTRHITQKRISICPNGYRDTNARKEIVV